MPRTFESRNKIVSIILLVLFILIGVICYYYTIGFSSFNKETAVTINDSVIQGISGLGSVAIAVIIF
ncbi:hypothetical protein MUO79_11435, partial [Candidatus Bathyarchaeota archaeon]|nr:hypothetical protein [Candidatus Bathyarchaeota archaeon]